MLSVTINKIMQKLPLIGVPWNLQFVIFKKIIYKVLEKNSCEISIEDYVYFLVLSNVWSEICETYWKIQSWKKMWQPLQPPPFPRTSMLSGFSLPLSPLTSMLSGFSYPSPPTSMLSGFSFLPATTVNNPNLSLKRGMGTIF